jgi:hypothetical protein
MNCNLGSGLFFNLLIINTLVASNQHNSLKAQFIGLPALHGHSHNRYSVFWLLSGNLF